MDPKVKNMIKFIFQNLVLPLVTIFLLIRLMGITDYLRLLGQAVLAFCFFMVGLKVYRRMILAPKDPKAMGKWAVITGKAPNPPAAAVLTHSAGTTSGIGRAFADHLAKKGMNLLIISRSEDKLKEQVKELEAEYKVSVRYLAYDFSIAGPVRTAYYAALETVLTELTLDGGIGLLVNNIGVANTIPKNLMEFTDEELDEMIQCNVCSTVGMTRTVFKHMLPRNTGAIVSISSGSGNAPAPFLAVYSATKAFMTQFSRSLKVEWWHTGVDFYVVTPFYVVSNLYKRKTGTIIAPMPDKLVKGTLAQIGKPGIYEGHGYWFHGVLQNLGYVYWNVYARNRQMMVDNRKRADESAARRAAKEGKDNKVE